MNPPKINFRTDYEVFKMMDGNRPINRRKVDKIKEDVSNGLNLFPYCPVIVFEKDELLFVVDGQHRFTASFELGLPIYYVVSEELNLYQIATMNSKQDKWTDNNFLNCYIELGNESYVVLKKLCDKHKIGIAVTSELLMNGNFQRKKAIIETFREGSFVANFHDEADKFLELLSSLFGRYKFYSDRNLIMALQMISDKGKCDF